MSQKRGYLIPENIRPRDYVCAQIRIPNDERHIVAFMGALTELSKWYSWETTNDTKGKQAADVWRNVIADLMWGCMEFRVANGRLQYRAGQSAPWVDGGEVCGCPEVTPQQGKNPGPDDTFDEIACAAADGLTEWIFSKYLDTIDIFESYVGGAGSVLDIASDFLGPAKIFVDFLASTLNAFAETGSSIARSFDTTERREEFKCSLYCALLGRQDINIDPVFQGEISNWIQDEFYDVVPGAIPFFFFWQSFKPETLQERLAIFSYGVGVCGMCDCAPTTDCDNWLIPSLASVTATNFAGGYNPQKMMDGDTSPGQQSRWATDFAPPQTVTFVLSTPQILKRIEWWDTLFFEENPTAGFIEYKTLGNLDWQVACTIEQLQPVAGAQYMRNFTLAQAISDVIAVQVRVTSTQANQYVSIVELKLYPC